MTRPPRAPAPPRSGVLARVRSARRFALSAIAGAQRSRIPQMAAALSYRTVFGLIPVLVVGLVAMKLFFTTDDQIADVLNQLMRYSGLSSITAPPPEMGPFPEGYPLPAASAQAAANLDAWIKNIVVTASGLNFKAIGLIGVVALVYAAFSMMVEVEHAFNQIFCVPAGRSWTRRFVNYWALLTLGVFGLFLSFRMTNWVSGEVLSAAQQYAGADPSSTILLGAAGFLSTVAISTAVFMLIYIVVPNTRVRVGPALVGAMAAAVLWEAGKWGFTQYLSYTSGYARIYGSIALIPIFLLWVYLTWMVILLGLSIAYYLQHGRHKTVAQPTELPAPAIVDPASILALMAAMARRFESGQPASAPELAEQLSLQEPIVEQMLERLAEAGLIHRVRHRGQDGYFALSRPPERVAAAEVLKLGEELLGPAGDASNPVTLAMQESRAALVRDRTLASFLEPVAAPAAPAPTPSAPTPPAADPHVTIPASRPDQPPLPVAPADNGRPPAAAPPGRPSPAAGPPLGVPPPQSGR